MSIFEVWSEDEEEAVNYVLHGYGSIDYYNDPDDDKLSGSSYNDSITRFEDGSYVVVGHTGNTYGDAFEVEERPYKFEKYSGESGFKLVYDDEECTEELDENDPRPTEPNFLDTEKLREWVVDEFPGIGGGSDTRDGSDDENTSDGSAPVYGGGGGYENVVTEDDADYVATDFSSLHNALNEASNGDVVFVDSNAEIYSPDKDDRFYVPPGVTLASDRGHDGSDGALIHTDAQYSYGGDGLIYTGDNARVSGLRVRGPHPDVRWREHSYDYEMSGIRARGSDVVIDNNEVWGWAINIRATTDSHVHHNYSHKANMEGLGYCVSIGSSEGVLIEYNHFEHWRHVVAGNGGGGYEARHNLIDGPSISHAFDQHSPGGSYTDIHHNTMRAGRQEDNDKRPILACFRGEDVDNAEVYNNWVWHNEQEPRNNPSGWTDEFIVQAKSDTWGDVSWWDNHLGLSDPPSDDIGAPRVTEDEESTDEEGADNEPEWFDAVAGFRKDAPNRLTEDDCDVTVNTKQELLSEVQTEGRTIWVGSDIDLTGCVNEPLASNVTLAGDRQPTTETDGPIVHVDDYDGVYTFKARGSDIRITGLRLRGPHVGIIDEYDSSKSRTFGLFLGDGCRFDNNEVYGWPFAGICSGAKTYTPSHTYAYNYFHHNCMDGLGYAAELYNGHHVFHHNYFDYDRHTIAGFGRRDNGYEAYKNVVGPNHLSHAFDMHALRQNVSGEDSWVAGKTILIHNNHSDFTHAISGYPQEAFKIRGIPDDVCEIYENTFKHEEEPTPPTENGDAYHQTNAGNDWANLEAYDNEFGSDLTFEVPDRYKPDKY